MLKCTIFSAPSSNLEIIKAPVSVNLLNDRFISTKLDIELIYAPTIGLRSSSLNLRLKFDVWFPGKFILQFPHLVYFVLQEI